MTKAIKIIGLIGLSAALVAIAPPTHAEPFIELDIDNGAIQYRQIDPNGPSIFEPSIQWVNNGNCGSPCDTVAIRGRRPDLVIGMPGANYFILQFAAGSDWFTSSPPRELPLEYAVSNNFFTTSLGAPGGTSVDFLLTSISARSGTSQGAPVLPRSNTFDFIGVVSKVLDPTGSLPPQVALGDEVRGSFEYAWGEFCKYSFSLWEDSNSYLCRLANGPPPSPPPSGQVNHIHVPLRVVTAPPIVWVDPPVVSGYDYEVISGPEIVSATLPVGIGDGAYEVMTWNAAQGDYESAGLVSGGIEFLFPAGPVTKFRIQGIEVAAGLDPNDPGAFVTGLKFSSRDPVDLTMTPLTSFIVPSLRAATLGILLMGLASLGFLHVSGECESRIKQDRQDQPHRAA